MKGLYYDQQKRCHFLEVRVPQEVIAIFGLKPGSKRKETFPQSVGADEAEHRAVKLLGEWKDEWKAIRESADPNAIAGSLIHHNGAGLSFAQLGRLTPEQAATVLALVG